MSLDLLRARQSNHRLASGAFRSAEEMVAWFGAVQAQDYLGALWGIGLRTRGATETRIEDAETRRAIVRTWPMRGTLHFVAAADARWLTQLLAPRVIARNAARWKRDFGVDARLVARADEIVTRALEGGKRLTREQIYAALESRRIRTDASRGLHLLLNLAMRGRLCLAGRAGKQHTFASLDDWLPATPVRERDAALAELATRYFTSHGPATQQDFMWWAGITATDAKIALDGARRTLEQESHAGRTWWSGPPRRVRGSTPAPRVMLLPAFDEYTVGYSDRSMLLESGSRLSPRAMVLLSPVVLVDGHTVGTWKRTIEGRGVRIEARLARQLSSAESTALNDAAAGYGRFLGLEATLRQRS
jgi:hypothetical protein